MTARAAAADRKSSAAARPEKTRVLRTEAGCELTCRWIELAEIEHLQSIVHQLAIEVRRRVVACNGDGVALHAFHGKTRRQVPGDIVGFRRRRHIECRRAGGVRLDVEPLKPPARTARLRTAAAACGSRLAAAAAAAARRIRVGRRCRGWDGRVGRFGGGRDLGGHGIASLEGEMKIDRLIARHRPENDVTSGANKAGEISREVIGRVGSEEDRVRAVDVG